MSQVGGGNYPKVCVIDRRLNGVVSRSIAAVGQNPDVRFLSELTNVPRCRLQVTKALFGIMKCDSDCELLRFCGSSSVHYRQHFPAFGRSNNPPSVLRVDIGRKMRAPVLAHRRIQDLHLPAIHLRGASQLCLTAPRFG